MQPFLRHFWTKTLEEVFFDATEIPFDDPRLVWLDLPPPDFRAYVEGSPRYPFDNVPQDPDQFRSSPTFLMAQAHRVWVTASLVAKYLADDGTLLNLGAYPFAIDFALRDYFQRTNPIVGTINQVLDAESREGLRLRRIETIPVNLDPRIHVHAPLEGMTDTLPLQSCSVDFVLMAHVIEHLYQPISILRDAIRVLRPGGKILITTDNAFLLGGFLSFLDPKRYVYEPVENSAAMVFHNWRGHVRFYSEGDLRALLSAAGASVVREVAMREVFYNILWDDYFVRPERTVVKWRADLLRDFPVYRNELMIVAEKN
jgi:SAM-dependent methyltransferase